MPPSEALPAALQSKIFSFIGGEGQLEEAADEPPPQPEPLAKVLTPSDVRLLGGRERGLVIKDGLMGPKQALAAHEAADGLQHQGLMRLAGMGRGEGLWHDQTRRGDHIIWVTDPSKREELPPALQAVLRKLSKVGRELRQDYASSELASGLGLVEQESVQIAWYPGDGKGFTRHLDAQVSHNTIERRVTALYYLNPAWLPEHGGCLRAFMGPESPARAARADKADVWDVAPQLDRLVLFRSDELEHEVLPAWHPRLAITMWFYGRPLASPAPPQDLSLVPIHLTQVNFSPADTRPSVRPLPVPSASRADMTSSIFVSVVSYRDSEAHPTVIDMLERALAPERVRVGLVWQINPDEDAHMVSSPALPESLKGNVSVITLDAAEASGPCWARHLAQGLWKGEKYVLQIDSHMRFRPGWDVYLIDQLKACPSEKPMLTTYPAGYELPHDIPYHVVEPVLLCPTKFDEADGMLRQTGRMLREIQKAPIPSPLWASGFSFSESTTILEVPYDPFLHQIFFGEEPCMAARLYTHGFTFYAPPETVLYHLWSRAHRPNFRARMGPKEEALKLRGLQRIRWACKGLA
ncbi:unnamed protein product [Chrysoparadoxa australica]